MNRSIHCREPQADPLVAAGHAERPAPAESGNAGSVGRAVRALLRLHGYRNFRGRLLDDLLSGLEDHG